MTKEELEKYLVGVGGLTRIYKDYKGPITKTNFFQVKEGWYNIIQACIDELLKLGWNKRIHQVKEKFGGLRFYVGDEDMPTGGYEVIEKYEKLSITTCEICGNDGVLRKGNWLKTLCEAHSDGAEKFNP